jgi:hypothetical protein
MLDITYYNKKADGQILIVPVSPGSGYSNYYANPAVIENKGIEALASIWVIRKDDGFKWRLGANFTRNRNMSR